MIRVVCSRCGYVIAEIDDALNLWVSLPSRCPRCGRELPRKPVRVEVR